MKNPSGGRILKWLIFGGIYLNLLNGMDNGGFFALLFIYVLIAMGFAWWAYSQDQDRERIGSDDFKNNNLLYRYGYSINDIALSVPLKSGWSTSQIKSFSEAIRKYIASKMRARFKSEDVDVVESVVIKDKDMLHDSRKFLRISFNTIRGSQVNHFINFSIAGKYMVVHYLTCVRGQYQWHDAADFVITAPLTIWLWGINWLRNEYSIISAISNVIDNSYDVLDLKTFFVSSYLALLEESRNYLKSKGLLTEEINQIIVNNINNSQNISVSKSQGVNLGSVVNAVRSASQSKV